MAGFMFGVVKTVFEGARGQNTGGFNKELSGRSSVAHGTVGAEVSAILYRGMRLLSLRSLSHDPGSGLAGVLWFADMELEFVSNGSLCLC